MLDIGTQFLEELNTIKGVSSRDHHEALEIYKIYWRMYPERIVTFHQIWKGYVSRFF